jgi:hypothetical protein
MRKIILILLLFTLVSSNKFLEREALPEELDDEIILQKGGFRSPSIKNGPRIPVNLAIKLGPANSGIKVKPGIKAKKILKQHYPIKPVIIKPDKPVKPVNSDIKFKPVKPANRGIKVKQALVPKKSNLPLKNNLNGKFPVQNPLNNKNEILIGKKGKDKKGLNVDVKGGIHAGVDVKHTKTRKSIHLGVDAKGKAGVNVKDGKVTIHKQGNLRGTGLANIFKGNNNKKDNKLVNNRRKQNNQITFNGHQQNHINNGRVKGGWKEIGGGFSGSDGGKFKRVVKGNVKRNLRGGFTGTGGGNFKRGVKGNVKIHQQDNNKGSHTKGSSRDSRRGSKSSKK